jgi:hypothetical protein
MYLLNRKWNNLCIIINALQSYRPTLPFTFISIFSILKRGRLQALIVGTHGINENLSFDILTDFITRVSLAQ